MKVTHRSYRSRFFNSLLKKYNIRLKSFLCIFSCFFHNYLHDNDDVTSDATLLNLFSATASKRLKPTCPEFRKI